MKVSVGSLVPSLIVGTRTTTWSTGVFAGTVIVAVPSGPTVTGSKVLPPSKLTFGAPVSSPGVAGLVWPVGSPSLSLTTVGVVLSLLSLTTKSRSPPSAAVGLLTSITFGVSSSGVTPGGTLPVPSSLMVPVPELPSVALTASLSTRLKNSLFSKVSSSRMGTSMTLLVSPGAKVTTPERAS